MPISKLWSIFHHADLRDLRLPPLLRPRPIFLLIQLSVNTRGLVLLNYCAEKAASSCFCIVFFLRASRTLLLPVAGKPPDGVAAFKGISSVLSLCNAFSAVRSRRSRRILRSCREALRKPPCVRNSVFGNRIVLSRPSSFQRREGAAEMVFL